MKGRPRARPIVATLILALLAPTTAWEKIPAAQTADSPPAQTSQGAKGPQPTTVEPTVSLEPPVSATLGRNMTPPSPIYQPEPPYSKQARMHNIEGTVVITIVIGTDGNVTDAQLKSNPLGWGLDQEALKTVRTWKFRPATRDGKPVAVRVIVEVTFRLFDHGNGPVVPPMPTQSLKGVVPPKPIYTPDPEYTDKARAAKLEGTVTLEVFVDKKGRVRQTEEVGPKLGLGLDKQAANIARKWRFIPATRNGKPIGAMGRIHITFKLK